MTEWTDTLLQIALVIYSIDKLGRWCFWSGTWLRDEFG
jgi:hypothetical protein